MVKFLLDVGFFIAGIFAGGLVGRYGKDLYYKFLGDEDVTDDVDLRNYEIICHGDEADCDCENEEDD